MYFNSEAGESVAMIHLFGIEYASEIRQCGESPKRLAIAAGISESYGTEISKGVKLAKYVQVSNGNSRFNAVSRESGKYSGQVQISKDFDSPNEDIEAMFDRE